VHENLKSFHYVLGYPSEFFIIYEIELKRSCLHIYIYMCVYVCIPLFYNRKFVRCNRQGMSPLFSGSRIVIRHYYSHFPLVIVMKVNYLAAA